jgi:hypothetical protein
MAETSRVLRCETSGGSRTYFFLGGGGTSTGLAVSPEAFISSPSFLFPPSSFLPLSIIPDDSTPLHLRFIMGVQEYEPGENFQLTDARIG